MDLGRTGGQRIRDSEGRGLGCLIERDILKLRCCTLRGGTDADRHFSEIDLGRVQHDAIGGLIDSDANRFGSLEPLAADVDDERQVVVFGRRRWREALGTDGRGEEQQEHERYAERGGPPPKVHDLSVT